MLFARNAVRHFVNILSKHDIRNNRPRRRLDNRLILSVPLVQVL